MCSDHAYHVGMLPTQAMMQPASAVHYCVEVWVKDKWRRVPNTTYHNQNAAELDAAWRRTQAMGLLEFQVSPYTPND